MVPFEFMEDGIPMASDKEFSATVNLQVKVRQGSTRNSLDNYWQLVVLLFA